MLRIFLGFLSLSATSVYGATCKLDAHKLPDIYVVGESHPSPVSRDVGKIVLKYAAQKKLEVASEISLDEGIGLMPWHIEVKNNSFIHPLESPVLFDMVGSMFFLDDLYKNPVKTPSDFAKRLCRWAYNNSLSREVLEKMSREEPGFSELEPWVQKVAAYAENSSFLKSKYNEDCQELSRGKGFWSEPSFSAIVMGQLYPYYYFQLVREKFSEDEFLVGGVDLNFPRSASEEYVQSRKMDHKIFFLARERYFMANSETYLCEAQARQSAIPFLIWTGSIHSYAMEKFLREKGIEFKSYVTYDRASAAELLRKLKIDDPIP